MKRLSMTAAITAALALSAGLPEFRAMRTARSSGPGGRACRSVLSRYRTNHIKPHQGARECARRRKQMGVGEFAPQPRDWAE